MRSWIATIAILLLVSINLTGQGFLHADGKKIVNGAGENVILRGVGTGNWMLMEGYMMKTSGIAGSHTQFRNKLIETIGETKTDSFYNVWLANHCNRNDIDSMASWGYNSIRAVMHYKWFTLPIEDEPVEGAHTWLDTGFELLDSLLDWCKDNEMYMILDLHGAPGGQSDNSEISDYDPAKPSLWESKANRDKTVALWKKLAERYSDEEWIGGYDLINETNWSFGAQGNTPLRELYMEITDSIRTVDTSHILFIEGNGYANDFSKMTPPWDDNMAYSFHKYGTYNRPENIEFVTRHRDAYNVPIWLGEAGENSNTWYRNLIDLCETSNIGWSMWPLKKEGINNPIRVHVNDDYWDLVNGWENNNLTQTAEESFQAVLKFADNHRVENCFIHKDLIDAHFRQPFTTETLPYTYNTIDSTIFAADFDMGRVGYAWFDKDSATYQYSQDKYTVWNHNWVYRNDGMDLETCSDVLNNGFSIGWIDSGEWTKYTIQNDTTAAFTLEMRYASGTGSGSKIHVEINGVDATGPLSLPYSGGWYNWRSIDFPGIIVPGGAAEVKVVFDQSGANFNYFRFKDPLPVSEVPFTYVSSLATDRAYEVYVTLNKSITAPEDISDFSDFKLFKNGVEIQIDSVKISEQPDNELVIYTSETLFFNNSLKISYEGSSIMHDDQPLTAFSQQLVSNQLARHWAVPSRIQAENFYRNNGLELEECTDVGGGFNTGYANYGDYLDYLVLVEEPGDYALDFRVATAYSNGALRIQYEKDGNFETLGDMKFTSTGGWQNWATQSTKVYLDSGKYLLRLLVSGGEHNLNWFQFKLAVGVGDMPSDMAVDIYPNPAKDFFRIQFSEPAEGHITLMDLQGRSVRKLEIKGYSHTIHTNDLSPGIYLLQIRSGAHTVTRKIVVE